MSRVIGIVSGKGGVGKTTLTINLGATLSHKYKKNVTIVDCNLTTSHLGIHLGMYYTPATINKVLREEIDISESIYPHFSGMKVVPASMSMSDLKGVDIYRIKDVVANIAERSDIVLLDASPGFGREAMGAIQASNEVLYVTTPHVPAVMDIVRCQEVLNEFNVRPIGVVLNMVGKNKYEMKKGEVEHFTGVQVISSIPYDKKVSKGLHQKIPVTLLHPNSPASREINRLAAKIIGEPHKEPSAFDFLKNIFG
jgi:septum site-determining protein MinD